jgi:hypothetical protein
MITGLSATDVLMPCLHPICHHAEVSENFVLQEKRRVPFRGLPEVSRIMDDLDLAESDKRIEFFRIRVLHAESESRR